MKRWIPGALCLLILCVVMPPPRLAAEMPASERDKVEALITHVETLTDAVFIRNGEAYPARVAVKFLRGKWKVKAAEITTAEEFIEKAASFSSTTGEPYRLRLADGRELLNREYLLDVLHKLGMQAAAPILQGENGTFALHEHLPLPVETLEHKLRYEPFSILKAQSTGRGITGAMKLQIRFLDGVELQVKWKTAPELGDSFNNSPRREVAAYEMQKLFLESKDYVVPVTALVCLPYEQIQRLDAAAKPQLEGTDCIFGTLSIWLNNVKQVDDVFDPQRFEQAAEEQGEGSYAWHFANFNIFTYLISHRDGHKSNFLVSTHPQSQRVFAIDNGLAFSGMGNPLPWGPRWKKLRVDKLPDTTVSRLQSLTKAQVYDILETLAEFTIAADGSVTPTLHFSPNLKPKKSLRRQASIFQVGLKHKEIEEIMVRLQQLLDKVKRNEIVLF